MKDVSELVFILDKSGSMSGKEEDVIGGFNSTIEKQKKKNYVTYVTTVLFSDNSCTLHDRVDIKNISKMSKKDFVCNGCTALMDTVGSTIEHIKDIQKYVENKPKKTLFVIMTDGLENASHKYNKDDIRNMISQQKEKHWEFIFMGANIDAVETAKEYGIDESRTAKFSTKHIKKAYKATNKVMDIMLNPKIDRCLAERKMCVSEWNKGLDED